VKKRRPEGSKAIATGRSRSAVTVSTTAPGGRGSKVTVGVVVAVMGAVAIEVGEEVGVSVTSRVGVAVSSPRRGGDKGGAEAREPAANERKAREARRQPRQRSHT
jgi:hypothetical protein